MKQKKYLYIVITIIVISTCILPTEKLKSDNSTMTIRLDEYGERINILEDQIDKNQKSEAELNSFNNTLQESLNEPNESNKILESQVKKNNHYGDYQGNDDFSHIINDNPIDKDYRIEYDELQEKSVSTTLEWATMEARYTIKWQEEINAALEYLYKSLSEQGSSNLKKSQKSWQTFINDESNFVNEEFVDTGEFGTQGMVRIATVKLCRTRDRAIELMEYIFILDRDTVDFVYDN